MILIGSRALSMHFKDVRNVDKSDYDFISSMEEFNQWIKENRSSIVSIRPTSENKFKAVVKRGNKKRSYEIELDKNEANSFVIDNVSELVEYGMEHIGFLGEKSLVLSPYALYLLKKSHIHYPVHFEKNVMDYHFLKSRVSAVENPVFDEFFRLKSDDAKVRYSKYRTPNLNVSNDKFFGKSGVSDGRVYVHDDLHDVVKHYERPIYEMLKTNMDSAWCEKDKFNLLPFALKVQCVQEEAYVIALERYYIPLIGKYDSPFWCYERALRRICTTLCSGYFRDFALDNYPAIIQAYDEEFVKKFTQAVISGKLTPMDHLVEK